MGTELPYPDAFAVRLGAAEQEIRSVREDLRRIDEKGTRGLGEVRHIVRRLQEDVKDVAEDVEDLRKGNLQMVIVERVDNVSKRLDRLTYAGWALAALFLAALGIILKVTGTG